MADDIDDDIHNSGPLEEWETPHLGRDLSGHFCPILRSHCHQRSRSSSGDGEEMKVAKYVHLTPAPHLYVCN